jgi:parvulin-like peptidyl-prolyl isomerase
MYRGFSVVLFCLLFLCGWGGLWAAEDEKSNKGDEAASKDVAKPLDYIAIVGGHRISIQEYISELRKGMRKRFYHGKIPEEEQKKFRKEVAEEMVERRLLIQEAERRSIKPDEAEVERAVKAFDEKFKDNEEWPKARDQVLPVLRKKLEGDSLAAQLKDSVHAIADPTQAELRAYYEAHKELFTTPERVRVSLIMLRVDPSSPSEVWKQASEEASAIVDRINNGADFAELARIHSSDASSQKGGDMGFVHAGMLGENAQSVLSLMEPGEVSAPVVLLEGVAIFRLDDRVEPKINAFEDVMQRATKLYKRENADKAWAALIEKLRAETPIQMNDAPWR